MPSDGSYPTAEGSSRKRLKTNSRDAGRPAGYPSKSPEVVSLVDSTPAKPHNTASTELLNQVGGQENGAPCAHEQSLRTLHGDLDTMRQLITCKICQRFLYEPYALTCGHTFCYSCLSQWMGQNNKKTCPDCRTVIKEQPAPSYLIRELVVVFTSKSELLPDGETSEEHSKMAKEEASIVAADKATDAGRVGGLFKGCFKKGNNQGPLFAIRDHNDNVDRCPQCLHEVEDGRCNMCNVRVRNEDEDSDLGWSDDDTDEELDQEFLDDLARDADADLAYDGYSDFGGYGEYGGPPSIPISDSEDDEDDEDDDDEAREQRRGFIVDDDEPIRYNSSDDGLSDSEVTEVEAPHRRQMRQAPIVLSDDEEDDDGPRPAPPRRRGFRTARNLEVEQRSLGSSQNFDSEDDDEDDDEPIQRNSQRSRNRIAARMTRRPTTVVSEPSDDDDSSSEPESEAHNDPAAMGGFSPLQYAEHESDDGSHGYFNGHEDDRSDGYDDETGAAEFGDGYGWGDEDGMSDASDEQSTATGWDPDAL